MNARALVVLTLLAAAVGWADSPRTPRPSTAYSASKALKLEVTPAVEIPGGSSGTRLELVEVGSRKVRYSVTLTVYDPDALVAESGHVALFTWAGSEADADAVVLVGPDGREVRRLAPKDFMTTAELRRGGRSSSHFNWAAVDYATGKAPHRFDEKEGQLVLGIAARMQRPTETPAPPIERRIDLATGQLVDGPDLRPRTVAELVAAFQQGPGPAHDEARDDLAQLHGSAPETLALWRAVADQARPDPRDLSVAIAGLCRKPDPQDFSRLRVLLFEPRAQEHDRAVALRALTPALSAAELDRLAGWLGGSESGLALPVVEALTARGHKPAIDAVLRYVKSSSAQAHVRERVLENLLTLSEFRADVVEIALGEGGGAAAGGFGFRLAELAKKDPAKGFQLALQVLPSSDSNLLWNVHNVLVGGLQRNNPWRGENFSTLLAAAGKPGTSVAKSKMMSWYLASMLIDSRRLDEAGKLIAQLGRLQGARDEDPALTALAQQGFLDWVKGDDAACLAAVKKLEAVKSKVSVCQPAWRPEHPGNAYCYRGPAEAIAEDLRKRCGGTLRARCEVLRDGTLEFTLTNTSRKTLLASTTTAELTWFQGGEALVPSSLRRKCAVRAGLTLAPGKPVKQACAIVPPWDLTSSNWPMRTDVELTAWLIKLPKGEHHPSTRCSAFAVR